MNLPVWLINHSQFERISFSSVLSKNFLCHSIRPLNGFLGQHCALQGPSTKPCTLLLRDTRIRSLVTLLSTDGPWHSQEQPMQTWIVHHKKTLFELIIDWLKKPTEQIYIIDQTCCTESNEMPWAVHPAEKVQPQSTHTRTQRWAPRTTTTQQQVITSPAGVQNTQNHVLLTSSVSLKLFILTIIWTIE